MKKTALIVGNANYLGASKLKNPLNDANSMSMVLKSSGFKTICLHDLGYVDFKKNIDDFGKLIAKCDASLFFYAGHGLQINGVNYLIPIDAVLEEECQVEYHCIRVDQVLTWMYQNIKKTNIIILDACRDNPFVRNWNRGNVALGLATMDAPQGTLIAYSTSPGKTASDGKGNNGLYTESLIKHITTPNLEIEKVFKMVRKEVLEKSNSKQIPWETTSLIGEFYVYEGMHSLKKASLEQEIYDYMESIWEQFEAIYDDDKAEALVFIKTSEHFSIPLIQVVRSYMIVSGEKYGSRLSDEEYDAIMVERLKTIGFEERNHRWYFEEKPIRIGEILPIPEIMEFRHPEKGKEIIVDIQCEYHFVDKKMYIKGFTNLPDGMDLMVSLSSNSDKYYAQSKVSIDKKCFTTEGFTKSGEKLSSGNYKIDISSPIASIQGIEVKKVIGERGENLTGDLVKFNLIHGNRIVFEYDLLIND
ncbi:caspase family protein [Xanthomarina sp.]|uniref:caspase family protein n=1 Tax=Xanthomarina sp. TaxID=1931211 RepID=UPI002C116195|nr:caspase family protein [Xanthomarina sp.]HLV39952.1 caspase family protein [Xanthomarina sp.]